MPNQTRLFMSGLSPRVRGNHHRVARPDPAHGSIPACAGEPSASAEPPKPCWVYPRVCGGTTGKAIRQSNSCGLSPRVRGNRGYPGLHAPTSRSIPACAGEPNRPHSTSCSSTVYPRVCGGTTKIDKGAKMGQGLSPRVRGNLLSLGLSRIQSRSIPACAGEPSARVYSVTSGRVYPRVCGGTPLPGRTRPSCRGLSPRVRGNHYPTLAEYLIGRSIPACAGEPRDRRAMLANRKVYPRVCGGTYSCPLAGSGVHGLSPRVRGNHTRILPYPSLSRSIPACAGEPPS